MRRRRLPEGPDRRPCSDRGASASRDVVAAILTATAFAVVKTLAPAADAYRDFMGVARWLIDALVASAAGGGLPPIRLVALAIDPTDLVVLPAILVGAWLAIRERGRRESCPADGR